MFKFAHFNFNVLNLEKSINFYKEALNLSVHKEIDTNDFTLVYLTDNKSDFTLELTYLKDRTEKYDLGEVEFHLAFEVNDFEEAYKKHKKMNCICYENKDMGIYFINDLDGYWIEIIPGKKNEK